MLRHQHAGCLRPPLPRFNSRGCVFDFTTESKLFPVEVGPLWFSAFFPRLDNEGLRDGR